MKIFLPPKVKYIIDKIDENNYEAFIVGGCVRDSVIGIQPHDYDITTSATPQKIMEIFKEFKCIETGIEHGTISVVIDNEIYEITTYRIEGEYKDYRRPDKVKFTCNLQDDLKRRDFTINAMAYNEKTKLVDIFGGKSDIDKKIIKTVGNPNERFNEDGLRMIRAIRFSSKLDFDIEEDTLKAIYDNAHIIENISKERITDEFSKIILSDRPENLIYLFKTKIFNHLNISEEFDDKKIDNLFKKIIVLKKIEKDLIKRLTIIDYIIEELNINCKNICNELIYSKKIVKIENILLECMSEIDVEKLDKINIKKILNKIGIDLFKTYLDINKIIYDNEKYFNKIIDILHEIEENNECYTIKNLNINGNDIISLGYKNEKIGEILNYLLEEVIKDPGLNEKKILLDKVQRIQ